MPVRYDNSKIGQPVREEGSLRPLVRLCLFSFFFSPSVRKGILCDLLWSDPDETVTGWLANDRGVSFAFGPDIVSRFLQKHDLDLICRAHQVRISPSSRCPAPH